MTNTPKTTHHGVRLVLVTIGRFLVNDSIVKFVSQAMPTGRCRALGRA